MKRRTLLKGMAATMPAWWLSRAFGQPTFQPVERGEPMAAGPFSADWHSLEKYSVPAWYQDAKFGIWAHWGAQCQPEHGDWYARQMYQEGTDDYKFHVEKYGHPSKAGFKDVIREWKAENWQPDELLALYKEAGARYFVALANHHDNFDNFNSRYHNWKSTRLGPQKDLIGGWAQAARKHGLHFGVSVHASHAWSWYEVSQRSDKSGALAGVPYDGKRTKAEGKGTWWEGYDPQELYAQGHALSENSLDNGAIHRQWNWGNGVTIPTKAYCEKFYNRTVDLINQYNPDLLYFDDTALPLWPVSDAGLRIAAHMYNHSISRHGSLQAVINGKILDPQQRKCLIWDIERGASNSIEPFVWQTDTCIGQWHYDRRVYEQKRYKSAATVIQTLLDTVSKNGNLLLSVPVRGDGTIDEQERAIVQEIGHWMKVNSEAVYGTRPWTRYGEGPAIASSAPLNAQGFNEGKGKPLAHEDFRFTRKENVLYATFFGWPPPEAPVLVRSIDSSQKVAEVSLLGFEPAVTWQQTGEGLQVRLPATEKRDIAYVLKIRFAG